MLRIALIALTVLALCLSACAPLATPEPPTVTRRSPTATSTPPTQTAIPVTATTAPPTETAMPATASPATKPSELSSEAAQALIAGRAAQAVQALRDKDFTQLASLVHPTLGVRFTPYGYVSAVDLVFEAEQVAAFATDPTKYVWGAYDGRGDPIELTVAEYSERFVYDRDFAAAPEVAFNTTNVRGSNTLDNWAEVYPEGIFAEYHFPQSDDPNAGFDWRALRLVFQQAGDAWYLVGVIHLEWTI